MAGVSGEIRRAIIFYRHRGVRETGGGGGRPHRDSDDCIANDANVNLS